MPTDEEIIQDAYYIRDLVNYSNKTKELTKAFFDLLSVEIAITLEQMSADRKLEIEVTHHPDVRGEIIQEKVVPFTERDYAKFNGIVEGLRWLQVEVEDLVRRANDEDERKKAEEKKE